MLKTLKAAVLNFEELAAIFCQIEACINSRPFYAISSDPKDLQCPWQLSYLYTLQSRTKWMQVQKDITVGSLILIKTPASFSTRWTPRWIVVTYPGADGICRVVTIQNSSGVMTRPVSQVAVFSLPPSTTSSSPLEDVKNS
ncbi:hypothetical protein TNCV_1745781 [Trichonephila clavipes]|nr:hypothetical protein TNCV_1745781 [Trichonephila clavipes]